jgi:mediator of RNA polymerase II transcription subunit 5
VTLTKVNDAVWLGLLFSADGLLGLKSKLGQALSSYLPLCVDVSLPLRHRLEELQKVFNLYPVQLSKALDEPAIHGVNVNALQFEASVMDGPVVNTRAGLYIYINSMVCHSHPLRYANG